MIDIYGTPSCSFCDKAKKLVQSKGLGYTYTDVSDEEERLNLELRLGAKVRSVPQIFVDNKHLPKGYNQLVEVLAAYSEQV